MSDVQNTKRTTWPRWLPALLGIVALVVAVNALAVTVVAVTPERCQSCHTTGDGALEVREGHADAACMDCHRGTTAVERLEFAGRQVYGMYLRVPDAASGRTVRSVTNTACESCHDVAASVSESGSIRIRHDACAADRQCTDCHSRVAHGDSVTWPRSYDMFECVPCHMTQAQSVQCDYCHTERSPEERVQTGTFALTHAANWRETHGMGDSLACAACHPSDKCISCHGPGVPHGPSFATNHSEFGTAEGAQCDSCHKPSFCDDCHGIEMPHPEAFTPGHSELVDAEGSATCERCHAPADCVNCHVKHVHPGNASQSRGD